MTESIVHIPSAVGALRTLSTMISAGKLPMHWWETQITPLPPESRKQLLNAVAVTLAHQIRGAGRFAQMLNISKAKQPSDFESVLFHLLLPLHRALIQRGVFSEALDLEVVIYVNFIKQDEDHEFYENSFSELYAPYKPVVKTGFETSQPLLNRHNPHEKGEEGATLFWFQNYNLLAHTQLVLDLASHLPGRARLYASAVSNIQLETSKKIFENAGIEVLKVDDSQSLSARCDELIRLCKDFKISNIVCVSLPLQSGYLRYICEEISLTWWSMKFNLGCIHHFDRLVCNRSLYPKKVNVSNSQWYCAPFALKALRPHPSPAPLGTGANGLNIGVLSREEKFASSSLPEILQASLSCHPELHLFWTGRNRPTSLEDRLTGRPSKGLERQVHYVGWVDPAMFLSQVDLLLDTPNLGGMVAYWAMSMGKVVISSTDSGSVGACGSRQELREHFELLSCIEEVQAYFDQPKPKPYYLSDAALIPICLKNYLADRSLLEKHGELFLQFFNTCLSDMGRWSSITYKMLNGIESELDKLSH